ncbi:MAG: hypothetical protein JWR18_3530 [Segetibacter sp.]|nr:hypothetical protein [Segetibacter sp.]
MQLPLATTQNALTPIFKITKMKKIVFPICFFASAILLFTQCKKDAPETASGNFSPLTTGSSWNYKYTEGSVSSTFKITATNRDTVANGKTYKVLSSSDGTLSYLGKVGNDYYRFASFPAIGVNSFEELYLKDNKALNETWTGAAAFKYMGADITANLTYTVKGKGETRTVNGNAFNNVTHVRLDIAIFGAGIGGGDFYYQEGVGLIEDSILVTPPSGGQPYSSKEEIVSFEIK